MNRQHLLSHTLYGVDIINYLVRLEYPDHITHIKSDDCGHAPYPIHRDGTIIAIRVEKIPSQNRPLPGRLAKVTFLDCTLPDCDAIKFAMHYYKSKGTPKTEDETIALLATTLYIKEPRTFRKESEEVEKGHEEKNVHMSPAMSGGLL